MFMQGYGYSNLLCKAGWTSSVSGIIAIEEARGSTRAYGPTHHEVELLPPLRPQLRPIFQPLFDIAFKSSLNRLVKLPPSDLFGEIVLAGKRVGFVVVVAVAFTVAFGTHEFGRGVEDGFGRHQRAAFFGHPEGRFPGGVNGVRFRRCGEIDGGLGQGQFAFGRA